MPLKEPVSDPQLPDLPAAPVPLQKAVLAAKAAAPAKTVQAKNAGGKPGVQKAAQKGAVHKRAAQKAAVEKGRKAPAQQLRAENGKRVKVVAAKGDPAKKSAPAQSREKVAVK